MESRFLRAAGSKIDFVDEAPAPVFALFGGLDERVFRGMEMSAGVAVLR